MTKLAPEWVRPRDPVIRSPVRYRWTTTPAAWIGLTAWSPFDLFYSTHPRWQTLPFLLIYQCFLFALVSQHLLSFHFSVNISWYILSSAACYISICSISFLQLIYNWFLVLLLIVGPSTMLSYLTGSCSRTDLCQVDQMKQLLYY